MAIVVALLVGACADEDVRLEEVGAGPTAAPPTGDVLDPSIFDDSATTIDGASFDLGSLEGSDVILWFWAPW